MFAKILRGLRRAALRFDAWMTEKPKRVSRPADPNWRHRQNVKFLNDGFTRYGRLRRGGDVSLGPLDD